MTSTNRLVVVFIFVVAGALSVRLGAHHGAAAFDVGKKLTLTGTVKEWIYRNPHCLLTLDVKGPDGTVVPWVAEAQAPNVVYPLGYRNDSCKAGDQVTVVVEPVKNGRPIGRILEATLADGKFLGVSGNSITPSAAVPGPSQP